jgi:CubicO group peptidase (beta-lactamase class C family)
MNRNILFFIANFLAIYLVAQNISGLKNLKPTDFGYKPNFFLKLSEDAFDSVPSLGSVLVWRENGIVCEAYFNGADSTTNFQLKSVTKTIVSALAGIAKDKGLLPGLQTPVLSALPEYASDNLKNKNVWYYSFLKETDSLKKKLTLKNLLTMQAGFLWDDNNPLSHRAFQASSDPVRFVLDLPFEEAPGTKFKYCTGASHILGAIVAKYVKTDLRSFADSTLFKYIGVSVSDWKCDPLGRMAGGAELSMKSRDMLKFGLLFLNEGKVNGRQLISKSWVMESTSAQAELNKWDVLPGANGYGYYWWRRTTNGHQAYVASGYGGQLICVIPDLKMIVVTTCFINDKNRGRSEIKRLHGIIDQITRVSK